MSRAGRAGRFTTVAAGPVAAALAAALALTACGPLDGADGAGSTSAVPEVTDAAGSADSVAPEAPAPDNRPDAAPEDTPADVQAALDTLATLEVKGRAPKTGYSRDQFGQRWKDTDRNGCDQRNDVLSRDMADVRRDGPCTVLAGTLEDPYTATTINFVRGQDTSSAVQIDHLVALSDAWQKGAQQLSPERREEFANDPANLLAVDGPANMQKGDGDAATWLPANRGFRCSYVAAQVGVKADYGLWVTVAERDAMERELGTCGDGGIGQPPAPVEGAVQDAAPAVEEAPAPAPEVPAVPAGDADVYYANCTAARAAGAAPILRGEPGYRPAMDGDGDGVACE